MRMLRIFIILCLVSLPLSQIARIPFGKDVFISPMDIVVGFTLFIWLMSFFLGKIKLPDRHFLLIVFIFPLFGIISLIINSISLAPIQFGVSFLYGVRLLSYTSFFFIVQNVDKKGKKYILFTLFFIGLLIV